tara:strand:+ start:203 stop:1150 length:948 start_codon:yes stop_codon:yes gene_type:complete
MDLNDIKKILKDSYSLNDSCVKIYGYCNGRTINKMKDIISEYDIDISHFNYKNKNIKYKIITKKCPICDVEFKTKGGHKKEKITCSTGCYNKYRGGLSEETKNKISTKLKELYKDGLPEETKRKISESLGGKNYKPIPEFRKCIICNIEFKLWKTKSGLLTKSETCSDECRHKLKSNNSKEVQLRLIEDGKHKGWVSRNIMSYPERFFKKVLELNGFKNKFTINHPVKKKDLGIDCNSNYFLDFYFDDIKFDLEIDGKQHNIKERKESDDIRDNLLKENGYTIYRIKWKSINNDIGKKYMKKEIDKLINYLKNKL